MEKENDVEEKWNSFWKEIILNEDGTVNLEQVKKELFDFSFMLEQVPKVYYEITGGFLSKPNYYAVDVINKADEYYEKLHELKPHSEYNFVDDDEVCVEDKDGSIKYFMIHYSDIMAAWMLIPFTDKNFKEVVKDEFGDVVRIFLHQYDYDVLKKIK